MLIFDLSPGQTVRVGDNVTLTVMKKTGQVCRLAFDADKSVRITKEDSKPDAPADPARRMIGISGKRG